MFALVEGGGVSRATRVAEIAEAQAKGIILSESAADLHVCHILGPTCHAA